MPGLLVGHPIFLFEHALLGISGHADDTYSSTIGPPHPSYPQIRPGR